MKRPARAGDGRAEHPFASASTLPMHEFMPDPHGLRCAVQARCNSCLVSRGDAPVGPALWDQMPCPRPCRAVYAHWALSCAASSFFWVTKPSNSCNHFFSVTKRNTKTGPDSLALTCRPPPDAERRGHPICHGAVQQPPAESWEVMRSVEASHRRNTSLTLLVSNRIRGTTRPRTGQWRPPL